MDALIYVRKIIPIIFHRNYIIDVDNLECATSFVHSPVTSLLPLKGYQKYGVDPKVLTLCVLHGPDGAVTYSCYRRDCDRTGGRHGLLLLILLLVCWQFHYLTISHSHYLCFYADWRYVFFGLHSGIFVV